MLGQSAVLQNLASPNETTAAISSQSPRNGAAQKEISPLDFCKLSSQHSLCLRGIAGASSESKRAIVFFAPEQDPHRDLPTSIPIDRIQSIQLLEKTPVENTPLHLPSLWKVAIELAPAPTEKFRIETTFESD